LHVRLRPPAGEGEHEFARAGLRVAAGLRERVLGGAGDGEGFDETIVERLRGPLARAQARDGGGEVGFRQLGRPQQRRLGGGNALAERPEGRQHLAERRLGEAVGLGAVEPHRAGDILHDFGRHRALRLPRGLANRECRRLREFRGAHVGDDQPVGNPSAQRQRLLAARRHEQRHVGPKRREFELDLARGEHGSGVVDLLALEHGAHDGDRIAHRGERTIGAQPHALGRRRNARTDGEPRAALRQLVERADLHRHQRGMPVVGIEDADTDADGARRRRAGRGRRQHAAGERVLGEPDRVISVRLGDAGELEALARIDRAGETHAQFW